jgi:hypothetical protein
MKFEHMWSHCSLVEVQACCIVICVLLHRCVLSYGVRAYILVSQDIYRTQQSPSSVCCEKRPCTHLVMLLLHDISSCVPESNSCHRMCQHFTSVALVTLGSLEGAKEHVLISLTTSMAAGSNGSFTGWNWASILSARDLAFLESERASAPGVTAGRWRSGDPYHPSSHRPQWLVLRIKSSQRVALLVVEVVNGLANCRKTPPARQGHFTVHSRPHRATIGPQCEGHRRRYVPRQPPGGIPGADHTNWDESRGAVRQHALHPNNTRPSSSLPPTLHYSWPLGCGQAWIRLHVVGEYSPTCRRTLITHPPSRAQ